MQITTTKNERGDITNDHTDMKRIIGNAVDSSVAISLIKILKGTSYQELTEEDIDNLDNFIAIK